MFQERFKLLKISSMYQGWLYTDPVKIQRIIINLLENAFKYAYTYVNLQIMDLGHRI